MATGCSPGWQLPFVCPRLDGQQVQGKARRWIVHQMNAKCGPQVGPNNATHNATFKQNKQQQQRQKSQTGAQFKLRLFCLSRRAGLQLTVNLLRLLLLLLLLFAAIRRRQLQFFTYSTDTSLSSAAAASAWLPCCLMKVTSDNGLGNNLRLYALQPSNYTAIGWRDIVSAIDIELYAAANWSASLVAALACRDYANVRANAMPKLTERSPADGSNPPIILRCNMV